MGKKKGGGVRIKQVGPKQPMMPVNPMEALQIPEEEMIHMQPPPDRTYKVFWPIHETFSMDITGFQVIYPSYLDSKKTVKMGRRVSLEKAVPTPTVMDISQALQSIQVRHVLQPYKGYSRDVSCQWDNPGRVMVDVSNLKKKEIMTKLSRLIPDLPDRHARLEREKEEKEKEEKERIEAIAASEQPKKVAAASGKKKGKKGKKK